MLKKLSIIIIIPGLTLSVIAAFWLHNKKTSQADLALNEELLQCFQARRGSPAEYMAKSVKFGYNRIRLATLTGNWSPCSPAQLRDLLGDLLRDIRIGRSWKCELQPVTVPYVSRPPVINGTMEKQEWKNALSFHGAYLLNSSLWLDDRSTWEIMYDNEFLYFAADFFDAHIVNNSPQKPYNDDSLELFIMPDKRLNTYIEMVFSPDGGRYTKWCGQTRQSPFEIEEFHPVRLESAVKKRPDGFSIEGKIGFSELPGYLLGNPPRPGQFLNFMMVRTNRDSGDDYRRSTPVPFLYDGHNIFGYLTAVLGKQPEGELVN